MRHFKSVLFLSAAAAALAVSAPASADPWDGFYLGGQFGLSDQDADVLLNNVKTGSIDSDASFGGFFTGLNLEVPGIPFLTLGAEASVRFPFDDFDDIDSGTSWEIGGRVGTTVFPRTHLYATGGFAGNNFKNGVRDNTFLSDDNGWFVGAGVELIFWEDAFVRAEYKRIDYGIVERGITTGLPVGDTGSRDVVQNLFTIGLGWYF